MPIMKFDKMKYSNIRDSIKDDEINNVLDKILDHKDINGKINLTKKETIYLNRINSMIDDDIVNLSHLSKNTTFKKISQLLEKNKKVRCDLYDKNGLIDDDIVEIINDFQKDICIIKLKHGDVSQLSDNYLYNINYDIKHDTYSLTIQDEYYEKIEVDDN